MVDNSRARALLILVAVFIAGGVVGAAIMRSFADGPRPEIRRDTRGTIEPDRIPLPLEQLGLTEEETNRLHAIARRWRPRANGAVDNMRHAVGDLENGMFAEMLCALTQEQRDRYLAQVSANRFSDDIINKRFALVRANRCGEVPH
jgi:hypothetical protein